MKTIIIRTQAELDALPDGFDEHTVIRIEGGKPHDRIVVRQVYENSSVKAYENSSVVAYENSSVEAYGNSSVEAWNNSSVVACGNSSVEAYENSSVEAWSNSSVVACGNSSVEAYENSSVEAYENSSVKAYGNSSVKACGNSSVVAYGNSSVHIYSSAIATAFMFSVVFIHSARAMVRYLADSSTAKLVDRNAKESQIERRDATAVVIHPMAEISFDTWLERGYVVADGIFQKLLDRKAIGEVEVFKVQSFPRKEESFVVRRGNLFAHGKTVEEAKESLKYKIADRDTTAFNGWKLSDLKPVDELIRAYRAITGACEFGVRQFVDEQGQLKESYTVKEVIEMTNGRYGHQEFRDFEWRSE